MSVFYRDRIEASIAALGERVAQVPTEVLDAVRESLASASLLASRLPGGEAEVVREATGAAFISGMTWALLLGAAIVAAGVALAWWLFPRRMAHVAE